MDETILLGRGADLIPLDRRVWEGHLAQVPEHGRHRLDFMTPDHHRVRYFVVREMPGLGRPIEPELIAGALELPLSQVIPILEDLERHLLFLVRNEQGAVAWAYPVTCEQTAHQVRFSSGERIYAA